MSRREEPGLKAKQLHLQPSDHSAITMSSLSVGSCVWHGLLALEETHFQHGTDRADAPVWNPDQMMMMMTTMTTTRMTTIK